MSTGKSIKVNGIREQSRNNDSYLSHLIRQHLTDIEMNNFKINISYVSPSCRKPRLTKLLKDF